MLFDSQLLIQPGRMHSSIAESMESITLWGWSGKLSELQYRNDWLKVRSVQIYVERDECT